MAGDEQKEFLITETEEVKTVSEYTGFDFEKCLSLDMRTFKCLFRDAFVYQMKQTEEGRKYLEDCYILQQTKPDRKKLRKKFGGDSG